MPAGRRPTLPAAAYAVTPLAIVNAATKPGRTREGQDISVGRDAA
jgi:hypothetical protein